MAQTIRQQAVVNGDGVARASIATDSSWRSWSITSITVSVSAQDDSECRIYLGSPSANELLFGTFSGALDTAEGQPFTLDPGEEITAEWTNSTPGAVATMVARYEVL